MEAVITCAGGLASPARDTLHSPLPEVEAVLRHPRFYEAARLYVQLTLETLAQSPVARQTLGNSARHVAFSLIATLSACAEHGVDAPPLTQSRVIDAVVGMGLASHGKIESLINRLADQRMITREPSADDRRAKLLRPTEALLAIDDALCALHARPCALLDADPVVLGVAAQERSVIRRMRAAALPLIEGGGAMLQRNPQMLPFLSADGGWMVLFALLDAVWREDARARRFEAIAAQCGVSRPHVRTLLTKAHSDGLLEQTAPGLLQPSAAFAGVTLVWIAETFAAFMRCCRAAQLLQDPCTAPALRNTNAPDFLQAHQAAACIDLDRRRDDHG
jgi:hypothetical protein